MRLKDADKVIQGLRRTIDAHQNGDDDELLTNRIFEKFIEWLMRAPAVEAEPIRHAGWIEERFHLTNPRCSWCGSYSLDGKHNFCPNCGAKMDRKENEK